MNEIERKELQGLGGWLVLFQIHIFNSLAGIVQLVILVPVFRLIGTYMMRSNVYASLDTNPFSVFDFIFSPIAIAIIAVLFVLTLLCIIFFYRKRIVFRTLFVIQSVVYLVGFGLYYFYIMTDMYTQTTDGFTAFDGVFFGFAIAFGLLPILGIAVAFIIALFKSHRVKNTFS